MRGDVCVIVNPASGRGRGAQMLAKIRESFAAVGVNDIRVTAAQHDEAKFASQAISDGRKTIVAVGGDGTISNVANAIIGSGSDARLAMIAAGTGNDFYKTVGAPARDVPATARLAVDGPDIRVDAGKIEDKHFLNVTGFGFDMAVLEDVQRIGWLSGPLLYNYSALRQLLFYKGVGIDITSAAGPRRQAHHLMLIIANCRHFGGTFRIAPDALLNDGKLDAVSFHDATPLRRLRLFAAAIAGTHPTQAEVKVERSERFTVRFAQPPAYEVDGEYNRASSTELEVRCVPRAIRVVTAGSEAAQ